MKDLYQAWLNWQEIMVLPVCAVIVLVSSLI